MPRQREQSADVERELVWVGAERVTRPAVMAARQERVGVLLAALDPPDGDDSPSRPTTMPGLKPAARGGDAPPDPRPRTRRARG